MYDADKNILNTCLINRSTKISYLTDGSKF
jgi:hypothetical protein